MKNFFDELSVLTTFLFAILLFYLSFNITIYSPIVNVFIFIIAIFVLIKGCDKLDKELSIGEYKDKNDDDDDDSNQQES